MFTGHIYEGDDLRVFAVPLKPRPYRHNVGLRPTQRWLLPGPDTAGQVLAKVELRQSRESELVGVLDDSSAANDTRQAAVAVAIAAGIDLDPELAGTADADDPHGARMARDLLAYVASNISEDVCVMSRRNGQWQLVGAAVFFPSHWNPMSKLGGGLEAIHAPVPDYARISAATEQAFERLATSEGVWERFNWTLTPDGQLCHTSSANYGVGVTEPPVSAADLWLRVERQTLTALNPDLVVFLIRTFLTPLPELVEAERQALNEAISGVSDELAKYRSWLGYREAVSRWAQGR